MAARIRRELGAEVELVGGDLREYTVLVDGEVVARAGRFCFIGVVPSQQTVMRELAARLRVSAPMTGD